MLSFALLWIDTCKKVKLAPCQSLRSATSMMTCTDWHTSAHSAFCMCRLANRETHNPLYTFPVWGNWDATEIIYGLPQNTPNNVHFSILDLLTKKGHRKRITRTVVCLQDLSVYSWLDCQPDDLFRLTHFSLREMPNGHPVLEYIVGYLTNWWQYMPGNHVIGPWLAYFADWSFTALPMQVCRSSVITCSTVDRIVKHCTESMGV